MDTRTQQQWVSKVDVVVGKSDALAEQNERGTLARMLGLTRGNPWVAQLSREQVADYTNAVVNQRYEEIPLPYWTTPELPNWRILGDPLEAAYRTERRSKAGR